MPERVGVYICECGPNIKEAVSIGALADFAKGLDNVVLVKPLNLLCSAAGQSILERDVREHNLTRVVIAACSPKEHEQTFQKVLKSAGLNPFLLQIANIREQCAWVIKDKKLATEKAKLLLKAAVSRVLYHESLQTKEIECQTDVLVAGAGVAGLSAALTLAQKNRKVYLIEQLPWIGGKLARYEKIFPELECASCVLAPGLDEILHHDHVRLLTGTEIQEVLGFYGNFIVKIKKNARYVDLKACIGCGACFEACPVKVKNEFNEGLNDRKAIYIPYPGALPAVAAIDTKSCLRFQGKTCDACSKACPFGAINYDAKDEFEELKVGAVVLATGFDLFDARKASQYGYGKIGDVFNSFEFERLLNSTGPTAGKILKKNGKAPKKIALIHCVGSRTKKFDEYCSGICCSYLLKFASMVREQLPKTVVFELYSDFCLPGKQAQSFCNALAKKKGIEFLHMRQPDAVKVSPNKDHVTIQYTDTQGKNKKLAVDMVVLAPAMEGSAGASGLAEVFGISQGKGGFFTEEHSHLSPVSTTSEGIFIVGCCQGPKDIASSVEQGQAAAGKILLRLIPGEKLTLSPKVAVIDNDLCSGCKMCMSLCPYKAITYDEKEKRCVINEVLCRGCGICVASCPSAAIKDKHSTDIQLSAEIKGLLK